jgi:glycogen(starch) synthase
VKMVIYSPAFHPMLGGLETVVQVLAAEWSRLGHAVTVVTNAANSEPNVFPFQVLRRAGFFEVVKAVRGCDVFVHANVSLWGFLPWLLCGWRRPAWVATHHGWYEDFGRPVTLLNRLKKWLCRFAAVNISVSHAVDQFLGVKGLVIPNPYDSRQFRRLENIPKTRDLVFLGRLVSDKGADLLIRALALLGEQGVRPSLTIIGSGPEREPLEELAVQCRVGGQITFMGAQSGEKLVQLLNEHRIMVVPSRWNEPFGVVALEGIACGCTVVGSSGGGLPEAIGPCGGTFPNGDVQGLAAALMVSMKHGSIDPENSLLSAGHLARHQAHVVAQAYAHVFTGVIDYATAEPGESRK